MKEEKINLKFMKVLTSQGWLKKDKYYTFGFTKEQIDEAKKRDYKNPLVVYEDASILALYSWKGKLRVNYFISYYGFEEGLGEHGLEKKFDNCVKCKCGLIFNNKKRKKGIDYLKEHLEDIKKFKKE
jgi:hypothetical protein